jgi:hypothetical protein
MGWFGESWGACSFVQPILWFSSETATFRLGGELPCSMVYRGFKGGDGVSLEGREGTDRAVAL